MKNVVLSITLVLAMTLSFTSCRETEKKADDVGDSIENAADKTEKEAEGKLEKAGKAVDNVVDETKEAGKAVEDAVKEISDDN
jgi:gas vesicle protein